ncbi:MAG: hypothetical protein AUK16_03010 [Parcubacteria group bacterium CG2_30_44_11]|nr:MAG: hypothetical protein AUK16_03010 [Parcubacteria group bacterium CG2_30_44_11]
MIRITDQYFWNIVFSGFFLGLVIMGTIILDTEAYRPYESLTIIDFLLMALAAQRFTQLFVYDATTKFFREQFYDAQLNKRGEVILFKPQSGPRRTVADFMSSPWCFGLWATATVAFFYLLTPYAYFPVLLLALSSVATTLQLATNFLVHRTEQVKLQNDDL